MKKPEKRKNSVIREGRTKRNPSLKRSSRNKMMLAAKIDDARIAKGLSKSEFAHAMNDRKPSEVTKWLSGTHNFTVDLLSEIEECLGVNFFLELAYNHTVEVSLQVTQDHTMDKDWAEERLPVNKFLFCETGSSVGTNVSAQVSSNMEVVPNE